ncbi:UDP-3-O-(3-hydroxymyristoyl)glucosamine N-acyltransferase [Candidatus Pelagibacter sp.]|nr:UDP-3-O-(3-hydroxymyristoyl)glucosamine N-acyltransferase [Candidatus Pelagibacter sp.]
MIIKNSFYKKKKNLNLNEINQAIGQKKNKNNTKISDIKILSLAKKNDISFFNSLRYLDLLKNTKAKYVIAHNKHKNIIKKFCEPILVDNVLKSVAIITKLFYPESLNDTADFLVKSPSKSKFKKVKFGKNVLVGNNVNIGKNTIVGHNTIIESNVQIGLNCEIGNNIVIKNCLIGNNVKILDGSIIGKKGFGFFPDEIKNFRYPHIGIVVIDDNVEIGSNNTIDRGSLSNTIIGKNTFLDNQVHVAHNVNIGKNCIITGQVGFAGSSSVGNKVYIGGQAGISGHLKIGNNVQIGGGSGVVKNIPDNSKVMGYPAKDIRSFLKENK